MTIVCFSCKEKKESVEFGKDSARASGLRGSCKRCTNASVQKRRKENPEHFREVTKKSRDKNYVNRKKARNISSSKPENREKQRLATRKYYLKNKEKCKAASKQWKKDNKERLKEYNTNRYEAKHPSSDRRWYRENQKTIEWADKEAGIDNSIFDSDSVDQLENLTKMIRE